MKHTDCEYCEYDEWDENHNYIGPDPMAPAFGVRNAILIMAICIFLVALFIF